MCLFPENTALRYRYEMRYRTATIMEEDALNKPNAAGEICLLNPPLSSLLVCFSLSHWEKGEEKTVSYSSALEADLSLHMLSESPCGSLVVYVIPESSSLLPEVKSFCKVLMDGRISVKSGSSNSDKNTQSKCLQPAFATPIPLRILTCILDSDAQLCCVLAPKWKWDGH